MSTSSAVNASGRLREVREDDYKSIRLYGSHLHEIPKEVQDRIRRGIYILRYLRENTKKMVWGRTQAYGIDVMTDTFLVRVQPEPERKDLKADSKINQKEVNWEEVEKNIREIGMEADSAHTFLSLGDSGVGKTVLIERLADQLNAPYTKLTGVEGRMPGQLIGYHDSITGEHVQGDIKRGKPILLFDEFNRESTMSHNPLSHTLTKGTLLVGDKEYRIAPEGQPFIAVFTANLLGSRGTREVGSFATDRMTSGVLFTMADETDEDLHRLFDTEGHWAWVKEQDLLMPIHATLYDIEELRQLFLKHTRIPPHVFEYVKKFYYTLKGLGLPEWEARLSGKTHLPKLWSEKLEHLPEDPLIEPFGGRYPAHLVTLARADALITDGSLDVTLSALHRMIPAVLTHRFMFRIGIGGREILHDVYKGNVTRFLEDMGRFAQELVPMPHR